MPTAHHPTHPSTSQSDVDALAHGLDRWAQYPVSPERAQELAAEFSQLHAAVQAGARGLAFDDEPSAYAVWLTPGAHRG
jgi:pyruvate/2-oxoacid:ferredoxin oxidoreductase alpha subunit